MASVRASALGQSLECTGRPLRVSKQALWGYFVAVFSLCFLLLFLVFFLAFSLRLWPPPLLPLRALRPSCLLSAFRILTRWALLCATPQPYGPEGVPYFLADFRFARFPLGPRQL